MTDAERFKLLDDFRRTGATATPLAFIDEAFRVGYSADCTDLNWYLRRADRTGSWVWCPEWVSDFAAEIIADAVGTGAAQTVLDPFARTGDVLIPAVARLADSVGFAIERDPNLAQVAARVNSAAPITWEVGNAFELLATGERIPKRINAVVSAPPWGTRENDELELNGVLLRDSLVNLTLASTCVRLAEGGIAVLVVAPRFFTDDSESSFRAHLGTLGLALTAVLHLPPGTFAPASSVGGELVVLRRGSQGAVLVAELANEAERLAAVRRNLRAAPRRGSLETGRAIPFAEFQPYPVIARCEERQRLARPYTGFEVVPLGDLVGSGPAAEMNLLFVPTAPVTDQVLAVLPEGAREDRYHRFAIDPVRCSVAWLLSYLNNPLGQALRAEAATGAALPRLGRGAAETLHVHVPPMEHQCRAAEAENRIALIENELHELRARLLSAPRELDDVAQRLNRVNHEDRLTDWLDTLPAPLATILWTYTAAPNDPQQKLTHLLHFFEGLTQFFATVHLSALCSQPALLAEEFPRSGGRGQSLTHASFGAWQQLWSRLAKRCRARLSSAEGAELVRTMFGTANEEVLRMLSTDALVNELTVAVNARNVWDAHAGNVTPEEADAAHRQLLPLLSRARATLGEHWEQYELIAAGDLALREDGIYDCTARRLMGARAPFPSRSYACQNALVKGGLYLLDTITRRPLRLLPFLKFGPPPPWVADTCYFFGRLEDRTKVRYVVYQTAPESARVDESPPQQLIELLTSLEL